MYPSSVNRGYRSGCRSYGAEKSLILVSILCQSRLSFWRPLPCKLIICGRVYPSSVNRGYRSGTDNHAYRRQYLAGIHPLSIEAIVLAEATPLYAPKSVCIHPLSIEAIVLAL